jgi:DNA-binding NarL/FixJ family response regulator
MDVRMPEMDGVEATRIIHERFPDVLVVMLTTFDDDRNVQTALSNGAVGYLLKDLPPADLIAVLRAVGSGVSLISPTVMAKLMVKLDSVMQDPNNSKQKASVPNWFQSLSSREREILKLLSEGFENKEIAGRLFLAEQTVKNYVSAIYTKIDVSNRIKATQLVHELKIL